MRVVVVNHVRQGYEETTYICNNCGVKIGTFRLYNGEHVVIDWSSRQKCSCGATLVKEVEVVELVPDVTESKYIEVDGKARGGR